MQPGLPEEQAQARSVRAGRGRLGAQLIMLAMVAGLVLGVFHSPVFWLDPGQVQVVAPDAVLEQAVAAALELPPEASSMLYPLSQVEQEILRLPQVQSVKVSRLLPRGLVVEVERRRPAAVVAGAENLLVVGADGVVVEVVPAGQPPAPLPLLTGLAVGATRPGERLAAEPAAVVEATVRALATGGTEGAVRLDCRDPFDWRLQVDRTEGLLGGADNLERKVRLFVSLRRELRQRGEDPAYIDVRVMQRPVWRPRGSGG